MIRKSKSSHLSYNMVECLLHVSITESNKSRYSTVFATCHFPTKCVEANFFDKINLNTLSVICIRKYLKQRESIFIENEENREKKCFDKYKQNLNHQ